MKIAVMPSKSAFGTEFNVAKHPGYTFQDLGETNFAAMYWKKSPHVSRQSLEDTNKEVYFIQYEHPLMKKPT